MARITVFGNHKGGVGKTFIVTGMAAELARRGYRVLALDVDPQGNLSRRMGYREAFLEERPTMAEAIYDRSPNTLATALLPCQWEEDWAARITLAPSKISLENRVPEAGVPGAWERLQDALCGPLDLEAAKVAGREFELLRTDPAVPGAYRGQSVADCFDYVIMDTAPTLGHLLVLAAVAADDVVITVAPEYDSVRGGQRLMDFINDPKTRKYLDLRCEVVGQIINGQRSGVADQAAMVDTAVNAWGSTVWSPHLPLRANLAGTQTHAEPPHAASGDAGKIIRPALEKLVDQYLAAA